VRFYALLHNSPYILYELRSGEAADLGCSGSPLLLPALSGSMDRCLRSFYTHNCVTFSTEGFALRYGGHGGHGDGGSLRRRAFLTFVPNLVHICTHPEKVIRKPRHAEPSFYWGVFNYLIDLSNPLFWIHLFGVCTIPRSLPPRPGGITTDVNFRCSCALCKVRSSFRVVAHKPNLAVLVTNPTNLLLFLTVGALMCHQFPNDIAPRVTVDTLHTSHRVKPISPCSPYGPYGPFPK
jgi:hypothetical protein